MFHHLHEPGMPGAQGSVQSDQLAALLRGAGLKRFLPAQTFVEHTLAGVLRPGDLALSFDDALRCHWEVALRVMEPLGLTGLFFVNTAVLTGSIDTLELDRWFRDTCFESLDQFYLEFHQELRRSRWAHDCEEALRHFVPASYLSGYFFYTDDDRTFRYLRDVVLGPRRYRAIMDAMQESRGVDRELLRQKLWLTEDMVLELHRRGHVIGLHGHTHPTRMAELSVERQREQYAENLSEIRRITGAAPICCAHPCNSYSLETLGVLRSLGVRLGFCSNLSLGADAGLLEQPREDAAELVRAMRSAA